MGTDMNQMVAHLNVEHFRKKLAEAIDEEQRETLLHLLAEEESKLADPMAARRNTGGKPRDSAA